MKIKNGLIVDLANVLFDLKLPNKESRMRTRFRKLLATHYNEVIEEERKQLYHEHYDKESSSVKDEYYKGYQELLNEYFTINNDEANKDMLVTVSNIMLNTDYEFSEELAEIYDIWCEEFEKTIEYYNKQKN